MKSSSIVRFGLGALALGLLLQACASGPQEGDEDVAKGSNAVQAPISTAKVQPALAASLQAAPEVHAIVTFSAPELDVPGGKQYGRAERTLALRAIKDTGARVISAVPGAKVRHRFQAINAVALSLDAAAVETLRNLPEVESVVLDQSGSGNLLQAVPLSRLDVVQAAGFSGSGVTVAILDSGLNRTHVDLADSLVAEACFCSGSSQGDGTGCCPNGQETQLGSGAAADDNGHGTNVTGIVTSNGTSAPKGGAPGAKIVAVKVLDMDNHFTFSSDVIAGLDWIISNRPDVKLVNASLGTGAMFPGTCDSDSSATPWKTAIDTLRANGVLFFASSGNDLSSTTMRIPACIANTVAVGAVWDSNVGAQTIFCNEASTAADKITCFTNSDSALDLLAPGAPMTSTGTGSNTATSTYYGTSQASPLAAACAALLLQKNSALTPAQIEAALKTSPTQITDARNGLVFPRLDCGAALASLNTSCTPESNTTFCSRLGKNCGSVSAADNCGQTRTVTSCGSCTSPQTCGGGGTTNVCGGGATTPCSGLCSSPTQFTGPGYSSGSLGTAATCSQTSANLSGANCGQFASGRTFRVNNVQVTCNGGNITLPAKRNGGYCFQASAGDFAWAYYTTW